MAHCCAICSALDREVARTWYKCSNCGHTICSNCFKGYACIACKGFGMYKVFNGY